MNWTERIGGSFLLAGIGMTSFEANAAPWIEDKAFFTENASLASSKVDAADLNGDGYIDLVFANGGGFDKGDDNSDLPQQAFFNNAGMGMTDVSAAIFGLGVSYNGRAVKLRDVDQDGNIDIILGTTWASQTQLFMNDGAGNFSNETVTNLPQGANSIGDIEVGDIDGDGDLDMLLADWGEESPVSQGTGGVTKLWQQMGEPGNFGAQGTAMFEDVTLGQMPNIGVRWSWDVEFVDVDNDFNLDIMVSSYASDKVSVVLFGNDGKGGFKDMTAGNVAQGKYALDIEPMDLNGDSFLDLVTVHDGVLGRNRVLLNNKNGVFADSTDLVWAKSENPSSFDFMAAFYDHDSDTKVDIVLGAIQTAVAKYSDRLMLNQGGQFKQWDNGQLPKYQAFAEVKPSAGTYAIVLADLNKDNRLDVVMAQNENAVDKKVLLGTDEIPVDTAPPIFVNYEKLGLLQFPGEQTIRVRCHDNKSPLMLHDFTEDEGLPYLESWADILPGDLDAEPGNKSNAGQWYGEYLWRINFAVLDADKFFYRICAIDAAGNKACTPIEQTDIEGGGMTESDTMSSMSVTDTDSGVSASGTDSGTIGTVSGTEPTDSSTSSATAGVSGTDSNSGPTESSWSDSSGGNPSSTSESSAGSGQYLPGEGCGCQSDAGSGLVALGLLPLLFRRRRLRARAMSR